MPTQTTRLSITSPLVDEFRAATTGLFTVTDAFRYNPRGGGSYLAAFAKPSKRLRDALFIDREVAVLLFDRTDVTPRWIRVLTTLIRAYSPRLFPTYAIVVHSDPRGNGPLRN